MSQKKSIIPGDNERICFLCGRHIWTERHHVFGGPNRKKSEFYNITVHLCHWCHNEPPNGVHHNRKTANDLKARCQRIAMEHYGWTVSEFRQHFGKNYLEDME